MVRKSSIRKAVALALSALGLAVVCDARAADGEWSIGLRAGLYSPNLRALNKEEFRSPFAGTADITDALGFNQPTDFQFRNPLPPLKAGDLLGLEFGWRVSRRNSLLLGFGTWQSSSQSTVQGQFPVQGEFEQVLASRKSEVSYNQLSLGWRFDALSRPKFKVYTRVVADELFDVHYREDYSFLFLSGPPQSFRKSILVQSKATGVMTFETGLGAEYFLRDWVSLGFESNYVFSYRRYNLRNGTLNIDFLDTDNLSLQMPSIPDPATLQNMLYKTEDNSGYKVMSLSFEGWNALARVNFYY